MPDLFDDLEKKYYPTIAKFAVSLRNGKFDGSGTIALETIELLKKIITEIEYGNPAEMLASMRTVGRIVTRLLPQESMVGNMVRRVMRIVREEFNATSAKESNLNGDASGDSLQNVVRAVGTARGSLFGDHLQDLRPSVMEHIDEYKIELETSSEMISSQASEHIHSNEIILTHGASRLVERFLRRAAKERKFHVILAEGADPDKSHAMAINLAKHVIECTVICDSAIMGVMSRVNKVILGTRAVLADGGLRARVGAHVVALAAKHYSVPVIVLAPLYKLCPLHLIAYEQDGFNTLISPQATLPYETGSVVHETQVFSPLYDYVPPDLVTLFVTNLGGNSPSYIYRMMSELYNPSDYQL